MIAPVDAAIGLAFAGVFVSYGLALRGRLKDFQRLVAAERERVERSRRAGLSSDAAERDHDEAAARLNEMLTRFPSNVVGRLLKVAPAPLFRPEREA